MKKIIRKLRNKNKQISEDLAELEKRKQRSEDINEIKQMLLDNLNIKTISFYTMHRSRY